MFLLAALQRKMHIQGLSVNEILIQWHVGNPGGKVALTALATTQHTVHNTRQPEKRMTDASRRSPKKAGDSKRIKHEPGEGWVKATEQKQGGKQAAEMLP